MKFYKNGIVSSTLMQELRQEPDGSLWEQVFYHNNPTSNKFSSSDDFANGVYKSPEMWFNFGVCKSLTSWEFLYIQRNTSSSSQVKYRWVQSKSPFTAAYADVAPSAVTRVTTSGYTDGGNGGMYILNSNTYMVVANSSNGNWFGATGCWTAYNGGIPGYPSTTVTSGDIMIFVRLDNTNLSSSKVKNYKTIDSFLTNNIIEI